MRADCERGAALLRVLVRFGCDFEPHGPIGLLEKFGHGDAVDVLVPVMRAGWLQQEDATAYDVAERSVVLVDQAQGIAEVVQFVTRLAAPCAVEDLAQFALV